MSEMRFHQHKTPRPSVLVDFTEYHLILLCYMLSCKTCSREGSE